MRTHANSMTLKQAINWQVSGGHEQLLLLVNVNTRTCIKVGKELKLQSIKNAVAPFDPDVMILTHTQAKALSGGEPMPIPERIPQPDREPLGPGAPDTDYTDATDQDVPESIETDGADSDIAKAILKLVAGQKQPVDEKKVRQIATEVVNGALKSFNMPAPTIVELKKIDGEVKNLGVQHSQFPLLLQVSNARLQDGHRLNVWLHGPAGTGKTTAAAKLAEALELKFYFNSAIDTKYELLGFLDATGKAVMTPFRQAWTDGGVYLFDECDASDASAILAFNGALANGHAPFPDCTMPRHKDCIIIAGANGAGTGATMEYTGRNKLDAAFLDRFVMIEWPIDSNLERAITGNDIWYQTVKNVRAKADKEGFRDFMVTPRASVYGAALLAAGIDMTTVKALTMKKGLSEEEFNRIK